MTQAPPLLPWRTRPSRDTQGFASPAVRRMATERGIDPGAVRGTGANGRVTQADLLAASASASRSATAVSTATGDERVPFNNVRKRAAVALVASKRAAPHALTLVAADYGAIESVRRAARGEFRSAEGFSLTALPFVARAVMDALHEYPLMNASVDGESLVVHRRVHLGIAVDLDFQGLVVPVIHDADGLRLRALARAIFDLASRARAKRLTPADLAGGTFTITNPGASGTWISFPILNAPQVGILATDGVSKQVIVDAERDQLAVAPIGHLCLTFDHRAFDGAYAGAFLRRVQEIVEIREWSTEL